MALEGSAADPSTSSPPGRGQPRVTPLEVGAGGAGYTGKGHLVGLSTTSGRRLGKQDVLGGGGEGCVYGVGGSLTFIRLDNCLSFSSF